MSQIDQAFLRAYDTDRAQDAPVATLPLPAAHPAASSPNRGPHFSVAPPAESSVAQYALPLEADPYSDELSSIGPVLQVMDPPAERRPLSSFAAPPEPPSESSFRPLLEVDAFRWPTVCHELWEEFAELFSPVVEQLLAADEAGRSMIGFYGTQQGVGCTTLQLCLAKLLADSGKNVAIVDGDFSTAQLANQLGLEVETGWAEVLSGNLPLAECVVQSMEDRIALLPLVQPSHSAGDLLSSIHASVSAGMLRYQFDLVLFDLGTAGIGPQASVAKTIGAQCRLDACLAVAEAGQTNLDEIQKIAETLGAECLGVIENQI